MRENEGLEDPAEDYVPPLDEMVRALQWEAQRGIQPDPITDDDGSEAFSRKHESLDDLIRSAHPAPERRYCFKCERWVSLGLGDPEGEDPRCEVCNWQQCICGGCKCNYRGFFRSSP